MDVPDPTAPLLTAASLKVGDVVQIAVQLQDKITRADFWWRRFAVVYDLHLRDIMRFEALTLKLQPDMGKDLREIDLRTSLERQVVMWLPPERWPQGVIAMHTKYVLTGRIKIKGDD